MIIQICVDATCETCSLNRVTMRVGRQRRGDGIIRRDHDATFRLKLHLDDCVSLSRSRRVATRSSSDSYPTTRFLCRRGSLGAARGSQKMGYTL